MAAAKATDRPRWEWEVSRRAADRDLGRRDPITPVVVTDGESPYGGVARQRSSAAVRTLLI